MGEKIEIGQKAKVNVKWKVLTIDYTPEAVDSIRAKFAKKYGVPKDNISVEPIIVSKDEEGNIVDFNNEIITNVREPLYQQKLFKPYLKERGIEDYDFDKLIEIDKSINAQINYDNYENHKTYTIKWIKWSNFMSYGPDNFFDFRNLKGLVLLSSDPANQGGKTTFCIDLLRFLLFGKVTSREDEWTLARAFNDFLPEATEVSVEGCVCIDNVDYIIKRVITRPALKKRTDKSKVTQKLSYYKLINGQYIDLPDEDDLENESGVSNIETNKIIKDAIGNERDFDLMICINADNLKGLISLKDTERGRLISRWIGLLPLEEKDKIARETFNKTIVPSLFLNKYSKEDLLTDIDDLKEANKTLAENIKAWDKEIKSSEKKLKEYKDTRDTLLQSKKKIDESLTATDVETVKAKIEQITADGKKKRAEKKDNEDALKEIGTIEFDEAHYKDMVAEDKRLSMEITEKLSSYNRIKGEIETLKKGEYCPTCGAKLKDVDNTKAIEDKEKELEKVKSEGSALRKTLKEISDEIEKLDGVREKYNDMLKLQLIIAKNEADISSLLAEYKENMSLLKGINDNEEAIKNNNRVDASLNVMKVNIQEEEARISEFQSKITESNTEIKRNEKDTETFDKIVKKISEEEVLVKNWRIYLDIVGKNGISKMVLRTALPTINAGLKNLLADVCDFDVEVDIDSRNDVAFYKIHDGVKAKLASGSGLEQTIASLALRSVLGRISSFSRPSFIVIDEVLGAVADVNYDNIKLLYDKIVKDFDIVFQITHLKQIADWHTTNVVIQKRNNISTIKTE